jgi:hypothetical protein
MDHIAHLLRENVFWYASIGLHIQTFAFADADQSAYSVIMIDTGSMQNYPPLLLVMAHIDGEYVVIDADNTDRPLIDKLVAADIPREKIIKGYAGERLPMPASPS